ncbi:MAG: glycosyl transferase [Planctomyces sp.]|nr:glycosyl transferase [Planctomyces sp.]
MRIAQIATAWESIPPQGYGGIERVIYYLVEELVQQGHDVTLFASGDSHTSARLVPICERAVRPAPDLHDAAPFHVSGCARAMAQADEFDLMHFHLDAVHLPFLQMTNVPHVTTWHAPIDCPEFRDLFHHFADEPLISISYSQREPAPERNWIANIYHGLPSDLYHLQPTPEGYLAFLGRICPEKGIDRAIRIANEVRMPLKVATKIDDDQQEYLEKEIMSRLDISHVEFVGEVSDAEKQDFLGNATALLFPIDWREPFGLVMIESMACGTPVIAMRQGSVEEIIEDGVTGFVCDNTDECILAFHKLNRISREECRQQFETRFTISRMAREYVNTYGALQESIEMY